MQFVVSPRNLEKGLIEWKERATGNKGFVSIEEVTQFAIQWLASETNKLNFLADNVKPLPQAEISNVQKIDNKTGIFQQLLKAKRQNG